MQFSGHVCLEDFAARSSSFRLFRANRVPQPQHRGASDNIPRRVKAKSRSEGNLIVRGTSSAFSAEQIGLLLGDDGLPASLQFRPRAVVSWFARLRTLAPSTRKDHLRGTRIVDACRHSLTPLGDVASLWPRPDAAVSGSRFCCRPRSPRASYATATTASGHRQCTAEGFQTAHD